MGWSAVGFSEIEEFPSAVLAHRFPKVKNYGDLTKYRDWGLGQQAVDLLVGGTPCQSFSVAGLRKGLADPRGNLALIFLGLVDVLRPKWVVWENVPGVLSSGDGRDFGAFLGALGQLGYGWAYRVLDAQYVGGCSLHGDEFGRGPVPQRRRRVFVVAHIGGRTDRAASILFEREGLQGHPAARGKSRKKAATVAGEGTDVSGGTALAFHHTQTPISGEVSPCLSKSMYGMGVATAAVGFDPTGSTVDASAVAPTLRGTSGGNVGHRAGVAYEAIDAIPFDTTQLTHPANRSNPQPGDPCHPLAAGAHPPAVVTHVVPLQDGRGIEKSQNGLGIGAEGDVAYTLDTTGAQSVAYTYSTPAIGSIKPDSVASTLTRHSGGGGETQNAAFVVQTMPTQDTVGALLAGDRAGNHGQMAQEGKLIPIAYNIPPQADITGTLTARGPEALGAPEVDGNFYIPVGTVLTASPVAFPTEFSAGSIGENVSPSLLAKNTMSVALNVAGQGQRIRSVEESSETLRATKRGPYTDYYVTPAMAFQKRGREGGREIDVGGDVAYALTAPNGGGRAHERNLMTPSLQVRRLTPMECERLQGFPDGHTNIPWKGKPISPDGPRYKALGNSMAVPVMRWIGWRIDRLERMFR